jgi:hypothetical protein
LEGERLRALQGAVVACPLLLLSPRLSMVRMHLVGWAFLFFFWMLRFEEKGEDA